ncbi:sensor histidine kinase [Egicoccus sp. AB-alg2]|uniref:sensor histidine kinase n=1 Tax=Egicoccus sp. AB-alg2 TaxID=3242693 RepID=UPI00359D3DB6
MDDQQLERISIATGLVASLAVGVPVLIEQVLGDGLFVGDHPMWWWTAYLVHLAVLLGFDLAPGLAPRLDERVMLGVQVVAGLVVFGLSAQFGFSSVLLVISAASAAYVLSARGAGLVVVFQTAVVFVLLVVLGMGWADVVLPTLVYGSFQAFAMLVVIGQRREADARERLAEVNADLQAATALLAANSRNEERLRIARELHDLVGHQLTALALNLEVASHRRGADQQAAVERARGMAKDLLQDVRAAVGELRHPLPSLRSAIDAVVAQVPHPRVHVEVDEDLAVDGDRATAVVRCVQEILTNAVRHSGADNLWLRISQDGSGGLEVDARDDGCGAARIVAGNGLTGMRERLSQLGGQLDYASTPDAGFHVAARLPAVTAP